MPELAKPQLHYIRELQTTRSFREEEQAFIIEGEMLLQEAIDSKVEILWLFGSFAQAPLVQKWASLLKVEFFLTSSERMQSLSGLTTSTELAAVVKMPEIKEVAVSGVQALLVDINDPGNMGTMFRTAEWFGVTELLLTRGCVDRYNPKTVRAAMGSLFRLPSRVIASPLDYLKQLEEAGGVSVATLVRGGETILPSTRPLCLLMGSEAHGLPDDIVKAANHKFTIMPKSDTDSLNVAISFAICMYELTHG